MIEFRIDEDHAGVRLDKFLRKKLSQEALAAKANLSVSYISMLERGQRTPPLDTLETLAKALSVSPVSLLS